ncbi:protein of unknown function DUF324 [Thermodesulfatator indicus DSM 15286]|uniref:CRISPR type III-associated protein domain-containing protein n=1 Tax=Thermodesulfatator indicus (strain DSM 15286 / JCM 11887 / CIR29812) TaxID=667014 RepID=F8A9G6_THEID|nr:RAMP superfamily CRISPR-associated protein [Thermodesulfatator indicus]AEH44109.1 protein of unknown function DUF324 [Thermodesulfatator indicus DSM 15286]
MSFKHYRVVLKLLSPLHIGKRKYRNLMETREYVPGRTLWGALTARITRDHFGADLSKYEEVGTFFHENFRFGYLWPSLDKKNPYFPWEKNDFDYLFKFGYMSQAGDYERKVSDEGQLHEVEYIGPKTRDDRDVYLVGDLWVKEDINSSNKGPFEGIRLEKNDLFFIKTKEEQKEISLKKIFGSLQLGGEKGYGWGRVKLESLTPTNSRKALGGIVFEVDGKDVVLQFAKNQYLTAHALAADWQLKDAENNNGQHFIKIKDGSVEGPIEPLTGYVLKQDNSWGIPSPPICFLPGSKIKENLSVKIAHFGILTNASGIG